MVERFVRDEEVGSSNLPAPTRLKLQMRKRIHIFYSGCVQGVGFRFATEDAATHLKLTGWVKNLPDGRVEAVVEGEEEKLKTFLEMIRTGAMKNYIRKEDISWSDAIGEFKDFSIRYF